MGWGVCSRSGGGVPVGGAIDIDSEEKNEKKAKESQHLFPGQQGAAEHKSDLTPLLLRWPHAVRHRHTHTHTH